MLLGHVEEQQSYKRNHTPMPEKHTRDVFAITGLPPEVLAVAFAKYSRSPLPVKEIINDLTEEKSAEFHEKWVIGYGDASVADMAMISVALENVSILASKVIEDNRLGSYQEKSTRYQIFDTSRFYRPQAIMDDPESSQIYEQTISDLMTAYSDTVELMMRYYRSAYPQPKDTTDTMYASKIKARSCDIARYILPVATLTNLGVIMSARGLRHAISKLKGHPLQEMKDLGAVIQRAAIDPAYNPQEAKIQPIFEDLVNHDSDEVRAAAERILNTIKLQVKGAPTLIKYTDAKEYLIKKDRAVYEAAQQALSGTPDTDHRVEFIAQDGTVEEQLISTFLYRGSRYSYNHILSQVRTMPDSEKQRIIRKIQDERSQFDWPSREFEVPGPLVFDTLMDYGAFRDLQRHRMCTQINQELWVDMGYETPRDLEAAGGLYVYKEVMEKAKAAITTLAKKHPYDAQYLIPMAFRKRTLFRMNLRELYHIIELRSKSGGHFSYRSLVYEMYEQFKEKHPLLAEHIRAVKMDFENEFFQR